MRQSELSTIFVWFVFVHVAPQKKKKKNARKFNNKQIDGNENSIIKIDCLPIAEPKHWPAYSTDVPAYIDSRGEDQSTCGQGLLQLRVRNEDTFPYRKRKLEQRF